MIYFLGIFTASLDRSIGMIDFASGKLIRKIEEAHPSPINKIELMSGEKESRLIVTGDDEGMIRIWDLGDPNCFEEPKGSCSNGSCTRSAKTSEIPAPDKRCKSEFHDHIDYISDFLMMPHKKLLISSSGDGYLHVYDTRKNLLKASSDPKETELLNLVSIGKENQYLAVGLLDGAIDIYAFNYWKKPIDRFIGHPSSIDCMIPVLTTNSNIDLKRRNNFVLTGGGDGIIRMISLMPNQFLGVVANMNIHGEGFSYIEDETKELPISCLALSHDQNWLAACSYHENIVYFWNDHLKLLKGTEVEVVEEEKVDLDVEKEVPHKKRRKNQHKRAAAVAFQQKQKSISNASTSSFFKNLN